MLEPGELMRLLIDDSGMIPTEKDPDTGGAGNFPLCLRKDTHFDPVESAGKVRLSVSSCLFDLDFHGGCALPGA